MKLLKKFAAGILLFMGLPITLFALVSVVSPTDAEDREGAIAALLLFGLPPTAVGGWLVWDLYQQHQNASKALERERSRERERLFLQLLKARGGKLTALQFATEADMSFEEAKEYLDRKAAQMNAFADVTDEGSIVYRFPQ